jgi:hypothetical protein
MEKSHDGVETVGGSGSLGVSCVGDSDGYDGLKTGSGLVNEIRGSNAV